jgi:hypothetical protein
LNDEHFSVEYEPWNKEKIYYDVWDLISTLNQTVKRNEHDKYYLPDIKSIEKVVEELEQEKRDNQFHIAEEESRDPKDRHSSYMLNMYKERFIKINYYLNLIKRVTNSPDKFSAIELSFGNDGMISGDIGYALEGLRPELDPNGDFQVLIENNH